MRRRGVAAVVDPYSSGRFLASAFSRRGVDCVAVLSQPRAPEIYRSSAAMEGFRAVVSHHGDLDETGRQLSRWGVAWVVAGSELGVDLADAMGEHLGLATHDAATRLARSSKTAMMEALARRDIAVPAQIGTGSLEQAVEWIRTWNRWPVVLKPARSTGSDGVSCCHSEVEVEGAFRRIVNRTNVLDRTNRVVVVQEYLPGTEYVVDTVSASGRHRAAAFWRYGRSARFPGAVGYDSLELLPGDGALQCRLLDYATSVLDALGFACGPAHCEIVVGPSGPRLVEVGARLHGGANPALAGACGIPTQIDLTVESCLDPEAFHAGAPSPYQLTTRLLVAFLMPHRPGRLRDLPRLAELEALPSLHELHVSKRARDPVPRVVGWVALLHERDDVLERDHYRIRDLETNGLYDIVSRDQSPTAATLPVNELGVP